MDIVRSNSAPNKLSKIISSNFGSTCVALINRIFKRSRIRLAPCLIGSKTQQNATYCCSMSQCPTELHQWKRSLALRFNMKNASQFLGERRLEGESGFVSSAMLDVSLRIGIPPTWRGNAFRSTMTRTIYRA
jgi:hypothetical protein